MCKCFLPTLTAEWHGNKRCVKLPKGLFCMHQMIPHHRNECSQHSQGAAQDQHGWRQNVVLLALDC
jgi:hypothetical protein